MRVLADGQIHRLTDTLTDANRFYNLSHAICYSYGADNKSIDNHDRANLHSISCVWCAFRCRPNAINIIKHVGHGNFYWRNGQKHGSMPSPAEDTLACSDILVTFAYAVYFTFIA